MDDLTQCLVIRDDLQKWLAADSTPLEIQQGEKPLTTLLKLFRGMPCPIRGGKRPLYEGRDRRKDQPASGGGHRK